VQLEEAMTLGLGLEYGTVELRRTDARWAQVADELIDVVRQALREMAVDVQHIGSTSVEGMLAKPIIDIAIRSAPGTTPADAIERLVALGYEYRGDAGDAGGLVFVLDGRAWFRVAHLHVVAHDDPQWARYLTVRERLRTDPAARAHYEGVKRMLAARYPNDRTAYATGKDEAVATIIGQTGPPSGS
jgi:GrpB-like predicted nucleotidyltransferase (UPF0157 family)